MNDESESSVWRRRETHTSICDWLHVCRIDLTNCYSLDSLWRCIQSPCDFLFPLLSYQSAIDILLFQQERNEKRCTMLSIHKYDSLLLCKWSESILAFMCTLAEWLVGLVGCTSCIQLVATLPHAPVVGCFVSWMYVLHPWIVPKWNFRSISSCSSNKMLFLAIFWCVCLCHKRPTRQQC